MPTQTLTTMTGGVEDAETPGTTRVRRIIGLHGASRGRVLPLQNLTVLQLGREGQVEGPLGLNDGEVSKHHATLEWDAGAGTFALTDVGSRNGTFVQGARIARELLWPGSVVRLGASLLLYEEVELPGFARLEPESAALLGPSLLLQRVRGEIRLVAPQSIPTLVIGESGVGKELVAEELHRQSGRTGPFVPVNCAAISPELAESEFFGHASGAFTGATRRAEGLFLAAQGGTLFLDEVGDLPLELQPKLLRALAKGEVRPVGSAQAHHVDVRVVSATHRDLASAVSAGSFRGDLLARLQGWTVSVPPLRARKEDVLALGRQILQRTAAHAALSTDASEALLLHDWPYNVRELEQVLWAACVRAGGGTVRREHLPPELGARLRDRVFSSPLGAGPVPLEALVARDRPPSRTELCQVLERVAGNMAQAADFFGKDRRQVYRWAERLEIDPERFRAALPKDPPVP